MVLRDFLLNLVVGELSGSSIADKILTILTNTNYTPSNTATKEELAVGSMINYLNRGLVDLHTRLNLRQEQVFVDCVEYMDTYVLSKPFAQYSGRNFPNKPKYISDSRFQPFKDNIIQIVSVADEAGEDLYTNDDNATWSVYVRNHNIIQVPFAENFVSLSITYRANHPTIPFSITRQFINATGEQFNGYFDLATPIVIAPYALRALQLYVAANYLSNIGSQEALANGNLYVQMYEHEINNIRTANPIHGNFTEYNTLLESGWV